MNCQGSAALVLSNGSRWRSEKESEEKTHEEECVWITEGEFKLMEVVRVEVEFRAEHNEAVTLKENRAVA